MNLSKLRSLLSLVFPADLSVGVYITPKGREHGVSVPKRAKQGDSGYDLVTMVGATVQPGEVVTFPTGIAFNTPTWDWDDVAIRIAWMIEPRTSLAKKFGLVPMARVGDSGYRPWVKDDRTGLENIMGEDGIVLAFRNVGTETIVIEPGERIGQVTFDFKFVPNLVEVSLADMDHTKRGGGRFGSSGRFGLGEGVDPT